MKALILAGGRGQRLDELSIGRNKCMVRVKGKPAIEYSLDCAADTDCSEIIIVVGHRAEEIIDHYGNRHRGRPLRYVIQWEQKGLVSAIEYAREAIDGDDFLLLLGDEILVRPRHQAMIDEFRQGGCFAICGLLRVEDRELIKRTYAVIQDEQNAVYRLIEKPRTPFNDLMGTGDCVFENGILEYIELTPIHHEREEKELPDLIQCAIDNGRTVKTFLVCDKYANINTAADVDMAEAILS